MKLNLGAVIDARYMVLRMLGQGSSAEVYLVEHTLLKRQYAIKAIIKSRHISGQLDGFREAMILDQLKHPKLPQIVDVFEDEHCFYIVREYIEGETLDSFVERCGPMALDKIEQVTSDIVSALTYLHQLPQPLIFRDLKPANIIINEQGNAYLIDFGIARFFKYNYDFDTVYIGTKGYAPPEQFGSGQTDARSDVYALGALVYFMLCGEHWHVVAKDLRWQVFYGEFLEHARDVIIKAMDFDMNHRYQSVVELYETLFKRQAFKKHLVLDLKEEIQLQDVKESNNEIPCLAMERHLIPTQIISLLGIKRGIGTTHIAWHTARYLQSKGYKTCFVERHQHSSCELMLDWYDGEKIGTTIKKEYATYKIEKIVVIKQPSQSDYLKLIDAQYQFVIVDYGALEGFRQHSDYFQATHKWLIMPSNCYSYNAVHACSASLNDFLQVKWVFNLCPEKRSRQIMKWLNVRIKSPITIENLLDIENIDRKGNPNDLFYQTLDLILGTGGQHSSR